MKENTEKMVIKADTRFVQLLISVAAMSDTKLKTNSEDCVRIMYSKEENQLVVDTVNKYAITSHIIDCYQTGFTVETGETDHPYSVLIEAAQILKYFKKFARPARGIVELEIDWEQGCYTLTGEAGIVTYKTCKDCMPDHNKFVEKILNIEYCTARPVTEFVLDQGLLGKVIKSVGLTPWVKETGSTEWHALDFAFADGLGIARISSQSADGIEYRYAIMRMCTLKAKGSIRVKNNGTQPADHSGDTAPKDTAPVKDTPQDTKPADHSGDTARTVKDTKKTPEKTAAEKKTAATADRLAEKIGAVRSVTPKMRDRLITAVKRGDEIEKALLYAFGSLKGWRVGECRKIITVAAM